MRAPEDPRISALQGGEYVKTATAEAEGLELLEDAAHGALAQSCGRGDGADALALLVQLAHQRGSLWAVAEGAPP